MYIRSVILSLIVHGSSFPGAGTGHQHQSTISAHVLSLRSSLEKPHRSTRKAKTKEKIKSAFGYRFAERGISQKKITIAEFRVKKKVQARFFFFFDITTALVTVTVTLALSLHMQDRDLTRKFSNAKSVPDALLRYIRKAAADALLASSKAWN